MKLDKIIITLSMTSIVMNASIAVVGPYLPIEA